MVKRVRGRVKIPAFFDSLKESKNSTVNKHKGLKMTEVCVLSPRLRHDKVNCNGSIRFVKSSDARQLGFTRDIHICLTHFSQRKTQNSNKCCYPLRDNQCQGLLGPCPQRLFKVFHFIDKNDDYIGTNICSGHLKEADTNTDVVSLSQYCPPSTRKVYDIF